MIVDGSFKDIQSKVGISNSDVIISNAKTVQNTWRVKTKDGGVSSVVTKVPDGVKIDAYYPDEVGYIYLRQILANVKKYEGRKFRLDIEVSKNSWQELGYDVYITSRYSADNTNRIPVIDTVTKPLQSGRNSISVEFEVPKSDKVQETVNGLSIAFRAIRLDKTSGNTSYTVHSVNMVEIGSVDSTIESVKLTQAQYEAVCEKLKELL